jgi:hypothetical protein
VSFTAFKGREHFGDLLTMIKRTLAQEIVSRRPYEVWNAFIDLIAKESYENLDPVQKIAQLCFVYESEVQNGGHFQYFENRGIQLIEETLAALRSLGAECQESVLARASLVYCRKDREAVETAQEFVNAALAAEYSDLDNSFHICKPSIQDLLRSFLDRNQDCFVEVLP